MKRMRFVFIFLLTLVFSGGVLMQTANARNVDVAGKFTGKYFYDNGSSGRFEGNIHQKGARIWGECKDQDGSRSTISGAVDGNKIDFIKTYSSDNHQVQYTGKLIPETNTVKGNWRINRNNSGNFVMNIRGVEAAEKVIRTTTAEKVVWTTTNVYYELKRDGTPKNVLVCDSRCYKMETKQCGGLTGQRRESLSTALSSNERGFLNMPSTGNRHLSQAEESVEK